MLSLHVTESDVYATGSCYSQAIQQPDVALSTAMHQVVTVLQDAHRPDLLCI